MRNCIFISPNYPAAHWKYVASLRENGWNTLCIGDAGYETFPMELRGSMTEYRRVSDLHVYDEVYRAAAYYISQYGRISRVESLNPYWSDLVAALALEFADAGAVPEELYPLEAAAFDEAFETLKQPAPRNVTGLRKASALAKEMGYPILITPAADKRLPSLTARDSGRLKEHFKAFPHDEFILRPVPAGERVAAVVFAVPGGEGMTQTALSAHAYTADGLAACGILFPEELTMAAAPEFGFLSVEAVKLAAADPRFGRKGAIVPVNFTDTPPHDYLIDCLNIEYSFDFRRAWADFGMRNAEMDLEHDGGNEFPAWPRRTCFTAFACRSFERSYKNPHEKILRRLGARLCRHERTADPQFGDYIYIFMGESPAELKRHIRFITE